MIEVYTLISERLRKQIYGSGITAISRTQRTTECNYSAKACNIQRQKKLMTISKYYNSFNTVFTAIIIKESLLTIR